MRYRLTFFRSISILSHYYSYYTNILALIIYWNQGYHFYFWTISVTFTLNWIWNGLILFGTTKESRTHQFLIWIFHFEFAYLTLLDLDEDEEVESPITIAKTVNLGLQSVPALALTVHYVFFSQDLKIIPLISILGSIVDISFTNAMTIKFQLRIRRVVYSFKSIKLIFPRFILNLLSIFCLCTIFGFISAIYRPWGIWIFLGASVCLYTYMTSRIPSTIFRSIYPLAGLGFTLLIQIELAYDQLIQVPNTGRLIQTIGGAIVIGLNYNGLQVFSQSNEVFWLSLLLAFGGAFLLWANISLFYDFEGERNFVQECRKIEFEQDYKLFADVGEKYGIEFAGPPDNDPLKDYLAPVVQKSILSQGLISRDPSRSHQSSLGPWKEVTFYQDDTAYPPEAYGNLPGSILSVLITSNLQYLIAGTEAAIKIFDFKEKSLVHSFIMEPGGKTEEIKKVILSNDSNYIIAGFGYFHISPIKIYHIERKELVYQFERWHGSNTVESLVVSPDNKYLIVARTYSMDKKYEEGIHVYSWDSKKEIHNFKSVYKKNDNKRITSLAISQDSRYLVAGYFHGMVKVFDLEKFKKVHEFRKLHSWIVFSLAVSENFVVSGSSDNSLKVCDLKKKKELYKFKQSGDTTLALAISSNSKYIITGGRDNKLRIFDLEEGLIVNIFNNYHGDYILSLAITPDLKYIISGSRDCTIKMLVCQDSI